MKRVAEGHTWAEAVVDCAATERIDVLVVTSPHPSDVSGEVLEVLLKAQCAVLVHKRPNP
jgi:hypothetical protein